MWFSKENFSKKRAALKMRTSIKKAVRAYFDETGAVEVETPALQICPTIDTHIHAFETFFDAIDGRWSEKLYLHTSPEFAMKKLLAAGAGDIYQLGAVYRNGELTKLHSPEFQLLEWYRIDCEYICLIEDCEKLLRKVAESAGIACYKYRDKVSDPFLSFEIITVLQAFDKYINIDLSSVLNDRDLFAELLSVKGMRIITSDRWEDLFHAAMAEFIEPHLGSPAPTILKDYPISMAALSRPCKDDLRYAERFELYVCGVELANAFGELTDPHVQRVRAECDLAEKKGIYGQDYPLDEGFIKALEQGVPLCSGCALGFDRLVMLAVGAESIHDVIWAPVEV